ncbi:hypothetical protein ACFL5T_01715 [Gemmatimonadota bacterium]
MKRLTAVARFVVGLFTLAFLMLLSVYTGRIMVVLLGVATLVVFSILRSTRPLWIAPMWGVVIPLGIGLSLVPVDVKFDRDFPNGVWVRPAVWGLLAGPIPREAGVPVIWHSGSCIVYGNEPDWALVVGLGGDRKAMAEKYRYQTPDLEIREQIREAALAHESYFAEHGTYAGLDLNESQWFEAVDCVTLEHEGNEDFYVIRGSHCDSPHVFEMTTDFELPESGKVRRVE